MFTLAVWSRVVQSRDVRCRVFSRPISRPICSGKLIVGLPEKTRCMTKVSYPSRNMISKQFDVFRNSATCCECYRKQSVPTADNKLSHRHRVKLH